MAVLRHFQSFSKLQIVFLLKRNQLIISIGIIYIDILYSQIFLIIKKEPIFIKISSLIHRYLSYLFDFDFHSFIPLPSSIKRPSIRLPSIRDRQLGTTIFDVT